MNKYMNKYKKTKRNRMSKYMYQQVRFPLKLLFSKAWKAFWIIESTGTYQRFLHFFSFSTDVYIGELEHDWKQQRN